MKFVFIDQDDTITSSSLLDPLLERGEVVVYDSIPQDEEEVVERGHEAHVIFFASTPFGPHLLDRLKNLKILQFLGTGVWNLVDVDYAKKKGIEVLNIEGYGNNAVAEFTIGLVFSLCRHINRAHLRMLDQVWDLEGLEGMEIEGSIFGVIGTGNIGELVARKASLLGAQVLAHDLYVKEELVKDYGVTYLSLEEVVSQSTILSLHLKTTEETTGMLDREMLNLMRPEALLINVARSQLIDYEVLYELLLHEKIKGAALDVFPKEPPDDYSFTQLKNVITTPHMGFFTDKAVHRMITSVIQQVVEVLDDKA